MPTNAISCPSENLLISTQSFILLHAVCSSPEPVQYLLFTCFSFKSSHVFQGLLTNSIVQTISCTREGVKVGREFPIPPARFGTRGVLLPPFRLCLCQSYSGPLTHTCRPRLVPLCSSYSSITPCTDPAFSSPTPPTSPSPTQGYTLCGPSSACRFRACSAPRHRKGELPNALMAEAVALPASPPGAASSPGPRLRFPHAPAPAPVCLPPRLAEPPGHGATRPDPLFSGDPTPPLRPGPHKGQGDPPLAEHGLEARPGRPGGARPGSVPSRSRSPLPTPGTPARL